MAASDDTTNMTRVDISICIPTYNAGAYFADTLGSVEAQDFQGRIEVIISDDESTDDTLATARDFAARSRHPYTILNHRRQGIGANWDHSMESARGTYIKLLMQDDILYPQHLSRLFAAMETDPRTGLGFSRHDILSSGADYTAWVGEYGNLHEGWHHKLTTGPVSGQRLLRDRNFLDFPPNKIGEPSVVLLRRSAVLATGNFSHRLKQSLDYEYWYRLLTRHDAYFIDEGLSAFRRHDGQMTAQNIRVTRKVVERARLLLYRSYLRHLFFYLSWWTRARLCRRIFKLYIHNLTDN